MGKGKKKKAVKNKITRKHNWHFQTKENNKEHKS